MLMTSVQLCPLILLLHLCRQTLSRKAHDQGLPVAEAAVVGTSLLHQKQALTQGGLQCANPHVRKCAHQRCALRSLTTQAVEDVPRLSRSISCRSDGLEGRHDVFNGRHGLLQGGAGDVEVVQGLRRY